MTQENLNLKIDRFLSGEMEVEEKITFEKLIQNDPVTAAEVKLQQDINEVLEDQNRLNLIETLNQLNEQYFPDTNPITTSAPKPIIRRLLPKMLAAASVAAIVFGLAYLFGNFGNMEQPSLALYDRYNTPPQFGVGTNMDITKSSRTGEAFFEAEKYSLAIPELQDKLKSDQKNTKLLFMLAYANSQIDHDKEATGIFEGLLLHKDSNLSDEIKWHFGLHLLKMKDYDRSLEMLNDVSAEFVSIVKGKDLIEQVKILQEE